MNSYGGGQPPSYDAVPAETQPERRPATEEDARKHGLQPGYNLEHWNPREAPFVFCGCVYDADSLGKRIFDTTVAVFPDRTDLLVRAAGRFWQVLIKFAGCFKRAMEVSNMIRKPQEMEEVQAYIDCGIE